MKYRVYLVIIICYFLLPFSVLFPYHHNGYQYLYPEPGAEQVPSRASILVRWKDILPDYIQNSDSCIQLITINRNSLPGHIRVASDHRTLLFKPDSALPGGQDIVVKIQPVLKHSGQIIFPLRYHFHVCDAEWTVPEFEYSQGALNKSDPFRCRSTELAIMTQSGVSIPSDFPHIDITVNENPYDGYIFINNIGDQPYNVIFNNDGVPVWYKRTPDRRRDFKVQRNGNISMLVREGYDFGQGFIALNTHYEEVRTYDAVNGYSTDEHELQVLEDGTYLLLGIRGVSVDMSHIVDGGKKEARVAESALQMFTPDDELILQFAALDHFHPADMIGYSPDDQPTDESFRFPHMNSIDIDDDGHIILSSKRISEVTKINRNTGEIIWRLGGANNQFQFIGDPLGGFYNQHSVRSLGNGRYTMFDNGCLHQPPVSRALEYELNTNEMTATLVWKFVEDPPTYAYHMGNVQRLPNGNTLINWAVQNLPKLTEVRPDGSKAFEMNFVNHYKTYRVFKFAWEGLAKKPYLVVESQLDHIALLINQFGDQHVDHYRIYGGKNRNPTTLIDTSKTTLKRLYHLENGTTYFFRITSVSDKGLESDYSNQESVQVNLVVPGQNMVLNGNFDMSEEYWIWTVKGDASAYCDSDNGYFRFNINHGGDRSDDIGLSQSGFLLAEGRVYQIEFDAWAVASRNFEVVVKKNSEPYTNYSRIGESYLTKKPKRFSYRFEMTDPTDVNASLMIYAGGNDNDVFIDDISLKMVDQSSAIKNTDIPMNADFELKPNFPNPFNLFTKIKFSVIKKISLHVAVLNITGQTMIEFTEKEYAPGEYQVKFDGSDLTSGLYLYRIQSSNTVRTGKMMLLK